MNISPEALKYLESYLRIATESYVGYAAVICVIIAICFYFISVRQDGFSLYNLLAYAFTLFFFAAVTYTAFASFQSVKQIFYAGYDNGPFYVGYFSKRADPVWEDAALEAVYPQSSVPPSNTLYDWCYLLDKKAGDSSLMVLKRFPNPCSNPPNAASPDAVTIVIDLDRRTVSYVREDGARELLYHIIAIL
jgi:hypothetical protein